MSIEDTVDLAKLGLKSYLRNSCERLLVAARQIEDCQGEGVVDFKNRKKIEMKGNRNGKTKHFMASFYGKRMMKQEKNDGCGSKEQELNVKLNR